MCFREAQLPRDTGVLDGSLWRCARAAIVTADQNDVSVRLRYSGRHGSYTHLGDQLDADARARVGAFQVIDQLLEILDRIDVVVGRRRNQSHTRGRMPHARNLGINFVTGKLPAFARLGALSDLDLQLSSVHEVIAGHAESSRCYLLDRAITRVAIRIDEVARRIFAALAGIASGSDTIHRNRE